MRALIVLVAAMMLGLGGGYAWSALSASHLKAHVPKVPRSKALEIPQSVEDKEWTQRAEKADKPAAALAPEPSETTEENGAAE